jgi:protein-disulfide isomerase-like protein with CxxC motif
MAAELYFIYDTHCPWSYATTPIVNAVQQFLPKININLWHCSYFSDADNVIEKAQINQVKELSTVNFSTDYVNNITQGKDSTLCANLMTWAANKTPQLALKLLNTLQTAHFSHGNELTSVNELTAIIDELKLSPPSKVFNNNRLTTDAEAQINEIYALQEIIETQAIPALLLAVNNDLILLNHNLYLSNPDAIIDGIQLELKKYN